MKIMKISLNILLIIICLLSFCTNEISQAKSIQISNKKTIKLNKTSKILYVGETFKLSISEVNKKIVWSTNNKSIATVSAKGKVTAKKNGKAIITAKVGSKKLKCAIIVKIKKVSNNGTLQLTGTFHEIKSSHINEDSMISYVLDLENEMPIIIPTDINQFTAKIKSIQIVPQDAKQEEEFKKYLGKKKTINGYIIEGITSWYIRDYGLTNVKIIR